MGRPWSTRPLWHLQVAVAWLGKGESVVSGRWVRTWSRRAFWQMEARVTWRIASASGQLSIAFQATTGENFLG